MNLILFLICLISAYLLGSISSAILICKLSGLPDPRTQGSGNPGATNVLRLGGKKLALLTLLGDALKGTLPVAICMLLGGSSFLAASLALAAFLGHLFPIFFNFRGGKGIATFLGALIAFNWLASLFWLATWLLVAIISRYSSLAGLLACLATPLYLYFFNTSAIAIIIFALMVVLIIYTHRENIKKLHKKTENKLKFNKP